MDFQDTTAREHHRCVQLTLSGQPCGLRAVAGGDRCYIHGLFRALNDGRSSIDVPLLEDEASILYVYSQVARALAQGSMPPSNANGILRCCRGAQRLIEEKRRHERSEARKKTGVRKQETGDTAANPQPEDQPSHADATAPVNLEDLVCAESAGEQEIQAPHSVESTSARNESVPAPQPWILEPDRKVIPPPQFADARKKFDDNLARSEGDLTMALIQRGREIRARGGHDRDGVINDIRDTHF